VYICIYIYVCTIPIRGTTLGAPSCVLTSGFTPSAQLQKHRGTPSTPALRQSAGAAEWPCGGHGWSLQDSRYVICHGERGPKATKYHQYVQHSSNGKFQRDLFKTISRYLKHMKCPKDSQDRFLCPRTLRFPGTAAGRRLSCCVLYWNVLSLSPCRQATWL